MTRPVPVARWGGLALLLAAAALAGFAAGRGTAPDRPACAGPVQAWVEDGRTVEAHLC